MMAGRTVGRGLAAVLLVACCVVPSLSKRMPKEGDQTLLLPTHNHLRFHEDNVGAIIHFNMQTFMEVENRTCCDNPPASVFNPELLDTEQWVAAAASFGAKYVILVVDHFSGFALFPSAASSYTSGNTPWAAKRADAGNIVRSFVEACGRHGVQPGFFYSVHANWEWNVTWFRTNRSELQEPFEKHAYTQLEELIALMGEDLGTIWFDAGVHLDNRTFVSELDELLAAAAEHTNLTCHSCGNLSLAPGVMWMGNEEAFMPYPNWYQNSPICDVFGGIDQGNASAVAPRWCAPHCDAVLREHIWFWRKDPPPAKTAEDLVTQYLTSVGRGANLVLDLQPNKTGLLLDADVAAYAAFGRALASLFTNEHGAIVAETAGPLPPGDEVRFGNTTATLLYGAVEVSEHLEHGQMVQEFNLSYRGPATGGRWAPLPLTDSWMLNASLKTIGRRRIVLYVLQEPIQASEFQIKATRFINATWLQREHEDPVWTPGGTQPHFRHAAVYEWSNLPTSDEETVGLTAVEGGGDSAGLRRGPGFDPRVLFELDAREPAKALRRNLAALERERRHNRHHGTPRRMWR